MRRLSLTLLTIAIAGWIVAGVTLVRGLRADGDHERSEWATRRNLSLLVSSLSMNSLVGLTLYRSAKKFVA
ncbi:hypothetical protein HARCEL1_05150 [Halococcoides cellulosivorans]|uniref:Uncharacterized protein n=1 Tax=Halococcoides cellulosivorans TaxID=1679096 RepID=A0A2R4X008_9EURY|nr:hypothetical protein HARCEL1_05150 [Halococcoides cellulosivorans]